MEISGVHRPLAHIGEEKYQMLELNRRLESYLGRVKLLEEENQLLRGEIHALQRSQSTKSQRKAQEDALNLARSEVQVAWREKDHVELEVSNLLEEIEELNLQRQKERAAKEEAKRRLVENKKKLEDEWRAQIWLKEEAAHLEKEVALQVHVHQEEMASLKSSRIISKPVLMAPQPSQVISLQGLGEDYSQRAAQAWKEAAGVYQKQIEQLEQSLDHARAHMAQINQDKKMNQLYVQDLAKELESTKVKRELLEKNVAQQKDRQNEHLQHLHAQVRALEAEKSDVGEQIGELLVDRRNLMQMKMALGMEVATYRALLDSESLRVNSQSTSKTSTRTVSLLAALSKPQGIHLGTQTISASCPLSCPPITASKSITHSKATLMSPTPSWTPTQSQQETPKRVLMTDEKVVCRSEETVKLEETPTATSTSPSNGTSSSSFRLEDANESYAAPISASEVPPTVDKTETILSVKEDMEKVLTDNQSEPEHATSGTEEEALISLADGHLSSLPQTPEREPSPRLHTEDAKVSEDDEEEEEIEVSTEIAQISHAPMFAWQENDSVAPEEKDVISELELDSENISENFIQECRVDTTVDLNRFGENLDEQVLCSLEGFRHDENKSEILTTESLSAIGTEEVPKIESIEKWDIMDKSDEVEGKTDVECSSTEVQDGQHSDPVQEAENKKEFEAEEGKVAEEHEEEVTEGDVEEWMNEEDLDVIDENPGEAAMAQDSFASKVHLHKNTEPTEKTSEIVEKYENVLVEEHLESDDESLNISASWTTDPGEADSYAQENTIADTRPLIHYRSDDETDANTQASHIGLSEPSDSEEEKDRHEGIFGGQNNSQRFGTMEDLSEEPEVSHSGDIIIEGSTETVEGESTDDHYEASTLSLTKQTQLQSMDAFAHAQKSEIATCEDKDEIKINFLEKELPESAPEIENESTEACEEDKTEAECSGTEVHEDIHSDAEITPEAVNEVQIESEDFNISVNMVKDETLEDLLESDFRNWKESNQTGEEMGNDQVFLVERQEESSPLLAWSETGKVSEAQPTLPTEQHSSEDALSIDNEETVQCGTQIKSEEEGSFKTQMNNFPLLTDKSLPDQSHKQAFTEELFEISTKTTHSDVLLFQTELTKEQVCPKEEEDEQSNLSMLTHADFTDSLSVPSGTNSRPDSQTNIANSDLEEFNSSEDESLNASQSSQLLSQVRMPIQQLDLGNVVSTSENDSLSFAGLLEDAMKEGFEEHHEAPQAAELDNEREINEEEHHTAMDNSSNDLADNVPGYPQMQEWVDLNRPEEVTGASLNTINATEELSDMTDQASDEIFEGNALSEESQTKDKDNDPHHFFSSSIKEDIWSTTKFEVAATYDSSDVNGTEDDNIHPHPSMTFEEDWGELGGLKPVNGKTEEETGISTAQSEEEDREEQKMPLDKQQQCRDVRDGQVEAVQSDESIDDGDSWSSGEE